MFGLFRKRDCVAPEPMVSAAALNLKHDLQQQLNDLVKERIWEQTNSANPVLGENEMVRGYMAGLQDMLDYLQERFEPF